MRVKFESFVVLTPAGIVISVQVIWSSTELASIGETQLTGVRAELQIHTRSRGPEAPHGFR